MRHVLALRGVRPLSTAAGFAGLGLSTRLLPALGRSNISEPTQIQRLAHPAVLSGSDVVLLDETGSGKTMAYALPVIHEMLRQHESASAGSPALPQALVLAPNRELCTQLLDVLRGLVADLPLRASALGEPDADADADFLVSTPVIALRDWRGPERVRWLVLDEADQLLSGSFKPAARSKYPIEQLVRALKNHAKAAAGRSRATTVAWRKWRGAKGGAAREAAHAALLAERAKEWSSKQFVLVAATMPSQGERNVDAWVRRQWPSAEWVRTGREHRGKAALQHVWVATPPEGRAEALRHAVIHGPPGRTLVFANSIDSAEAAAAVLRDATRCGVFHKSVRRRPPAATRTFSSQHASHAISTGATRGATRARGRLPGGAAAGARVHGARRARARLPGRRARRAIRGGDQRRRVYAPGRPHRARWQRRHGDDYLRRRVRRPGGSAARGDGGGPTGGRDVLAEALVPPPRAARREHGLS
jgi:superfamily II DNA/RNA helicase